MDFELLDIIVAAIVAMAILGPISVIIASARRRRDEYRRRAETDLRIRGC
jgi:hypothetical protein